jgi:uncharacterized protein with HEPN domain
MARDSPPPAPPPGRPPERRHREDPRRDPALLLDMLLAAEDALRFVAGMDEAAFRASDLHQSAVIRKLEIIGEAATRVSSTFRAAHPNLPWRAVIGMRNRLIHGYDEVRLEQVWAVLHHHLPSLIATLRPLIPPDDPAQP